MRATVLALILLIAGSAFASAATDDELRQQIVGSWADMAVCGEAALIFNADGTFELARDGEAPADQTAGTYKVVNGILSGETSQGPMPELAVRLDGGQLVFERDGQMVNTLVRCSR
jgi:hypothetical protein